MGSALAEIEIGNSKYTINDIRQWSKGVRGELEEPPRDIIEALSGLLINSFHPAFLKFAAICGRMEFGTIKELKIKDGLPVYVTYDIKTELDAVIETSKMLV